MAMDLFNAVFPPAPGGRIFTIGEQASAHMSHPRAHAPTDNETGSPSKSGPTTRSAKGESLSNTIDSSRTGKGRSTTRLQRGFHKSNSSGGSPQKGLPRQTTAVKKVPVNDTSEPLLPHLSPAEQLQFSRSWKIATTVLSQWYRPDPKCAAPDPIPIEHLPAVDLCAGDVGEWEKEEQLRAGQWHSQLARLDKEARQEAEISHAFGYLVNVTNPNASGIEPPSDNGSDAIGYDKSRRAPKSQTYRGLGRKPGNIKNTETVEANIRHCPKQPDASDDLPGQIGLLFKWYFERILLPRWETCEKLAVIQIINSATDENNSVLLNLTRYFRYVLAIYIYPLRRFMLPVLPFGQHILVDRVHKGIKIIARGTLPETQLIELLRESFHHYGLSCLGIEPLDNSGPNTATLNEFYGLCTWVSAIQSVGFGDTFAQRVFAEVISSLVASHVRLKFSKRWTPTSTSEKELQYWITETLMPFASTVLERLQNGNATASPQSIVTAEQWLEIAITRLGTLRSEELFDIIVDFDRDVHGAIQDLKLAIVTPMARSFLTNTFVATINKRLIQPGASTMQILQVYISIIRAFSLLDPRGVLLDRVAWPIRRYLREREDTVPLIVDGLLADPDEFDPMLPVNKLVELADEMVNHSGLSDDGDHDDLDFDDMDWMPDPSDAGPEYRKSKNSDVIGSLISLFETNDIFVNEFQKILAGRLLQKTHGFDREIYLLELLKRRFGEPPLQACEVMLRDILDSRRCDEAIHKSEMFRRDTRADGQNQVDPASFHSRILSYLYWPDAPEETFTLPTGISQLQRRYGETFETMKNSRKLTWLPSLGQVNLTLEFEDRKFSEEVTPLQAAVIHAFQTSSSKTSNPGLGTALTIEELSATVSLEGPALTAALSFWISKQVLYASPSTPPSYAVIERLDAIPSATKASRFRPLPAGPETGSVPLAPTVDPRKKEMMDKYSPYIVGMLTNAPGPMPLSHIQMMLQMVVPGGFASSSDDLKDLMYDMSRSEGAGSLQIDQGAYRLRK